MTRDGTVEASHEEALRTGVGTVPGVWAGAKLGLGRSKSLEMLAAGTFPCRVLRLGRQYRVPAASLRRLLDLPVEQGNGAHRPVSA